jgi:hypothetical protein
MASFGIYSASPEHFRAETFADSAPALRQIAEAFDSPFKIRKPE